MSGLSVHGLRVVLGGRPVVDGVDLDVEAGEWVGIIGPNGAGKTTLLRAVLGLVQPEVGAIAIGGRPVVDMTRTERARLVASVPQRPVVPGEMRVIDYVLLGRTPHIPYLAAESEEDVFAVREALTSLDLEGFEDRALGELSGGELQRVVLARALAQDAPILLLDEPTTALDVGHQQQVLALVDHLRLTSELTVISALHDLTLAAQFCDRLMMIAAGRVVAHGSADLVLTERAIREHYGASVRVLEDGSGGVVVIPVREVERVEARGAMMVER